MNVASKRFTQNFSALAFIAVGLIDIVFASWFSWHLDWLFLPDSIGFLALFRSLPLAGSRDLFWWR